MGGSALLGILWNCAADEAQQQDGAGRYTPTCAGHACLLPWALVSPSGKGISVENEQFSLRHHYAH